MFKLVLVVVLLAPLVLAQTTCDPLCCQQVVGGDCIDKAVPTCGGVCNGVCSSKTASCDCPADCLSRNGPNSCSIWSCNSVNGACERTFRPAGYNCEQNDFCDGKRCDGAGTCVQQDEPCPSEFACAPFGCDNVAQQCTGISQEDDLFCEDKYAGNPCVETAVCIIGNPNKDADGCVVTFKPVDTECGQQDDACLGPRCTAQGQCVTSERICPDLDGWQCTVPVCNSIQGCIEPQRDFICNYLDSACTDGVCLGDTSEIPDSNGCNRIPKDGATCQSDPPPNQCQESTGTCNDGSCEYQNVAGPCQGCVLPIGASPDCYECICLDGQCIANELTLSVCDSGNECKFGSCQANTGGVFVCVDGNNKPGSPSCSTCQAGPGSDPDCYECNCQEGQCIPFSQTGAPCNDGVPCTSSDSCQQDFTCAGINNDNYCDARIPEANDCERSRCRPANAGADANGCVSSPLPTTELCRPAAGDCDVPETCDGTNLQCPFDAKLGPNDFPCRPGSGPCDRTEVCDGVNNDCPFDAVQPPTVTCRAGSGDVCDPEEKCDGVNKACPEDVRQPADFVCRPGSGDLCDEDETCPDTPRGACPQDDAPSNAGLTCRDGQGSPNGGSECDPEEVCTGQPGEPCPDQFCNVGQTCRPSTGECDLVETCPNSQQACDDENVFVCPPNQFKAAGTPCGIDDGNSCTVQACTGSSSTCVTTVLPDDTPCTNACGSGSCQSGVCLCPCELECVLTRGAVERNSPGAKGKARNDPVWQTDLFQNTQVCGLSLDDWFNEKKDTLPAGCENDLLAQYYTVLYNIERFKLETGTACDGLANEPEVQAVMDYVEALLPLSLTECQTIQVVECANKVQTLSNFSEGLNTVEYCASSLPITPAVSSVVSSGDQEDDTPKKDGGSDDDDHLGAGGIIAIVFGSIVGLILLGLFAFIIFGAMGNTMSKPKKKGYRRQAEDANESF